MAAYTTIMVKDHASPHRVLSVMGNFHKPARLKWNKGMWLGIKEDFEKGTRYQMANG